MSSVNKKVKGVRYPNQNQARGTQARNAPAIRAIYGGAPPRATPHVEFQRESSDVDQRIVPNDALHTGMTTTSTSINDVLQELLRLQGQNPSGKIEMGLMPFGWLVNQAAETDIVEQPPQDAVFESVEVRAQGSGDFVSLELSLDVIILKEGWTQVPLASSSLIIDAIEIEQVVDPNVSAHSAPAVVGSSTDPPLEASADPVVDTEQTPNDPCSYVAIANSYFKLFSYGAARWKVKLIGKSPFASYQNRNFGLWIPESTCVNIWFTVPKPDVLISVENALEQSQTIEETKTTVYAMLAPTNRVALNWTDRIAEATGALDEEKEQVQVTVTAEQQNMVTIGEVLLSHRYTWSLHILHGRRFSFEIEIPEGLVVRNVVGSNIKSWEVTTGQKISRASSPKPGSDPPIPLAGDDGASTDSTAKKRVLRIYHQYGEEGSYQLTVLAETPLKEREGAVSVMPCKMRDVDRETGFMAIEGPSNIEVTENANDDLSRIDIQELPRALYNSASSSVLYAYKFVNSAWSYNMSIKRHQDMEVLIAVIDEAWIFSTVTMEGKVQTKMELKIRNTTRQYLRIHLPDGAHIWSVEVNNNLVKPANDVTDKSVMIPLHKTGGGKDQGKDFFWTDVVYIYTQKVMKGRGEISITLPSFDLPANHLFVALYLPENFEYGEFEGDLKEVKEFSEFKSRGTVDNAVAILAAGKVSMAKKKLAKGGLVSHFGTGWADDDGYDGAPPTGLEEPLLEDFGSFTGQAKGTKPVRVIVKPVGREFRFERLLTDQETFALTVDYVEIKKSFWKKRHVGVCFGLCC